MNWRDVKNLPSVAFTCGHCGNRVATPIGYECDPSSCALRICPHCRRPTYFEPGKQFPGVAPGVDVANVPADVNGLYQEARNAVAIGSYTAAVLCCRKLLMHLAVTQGAKPGDSFVSYVDHLAAQGYVPPHGKAWVDHIRKKGNEANHEIRVMTREDAEELIVFAEMLLKFMFEFPSRVPRSGP